MEARTVHVVVHIHIHTQILSCKHTNTRHFSGSFSSIYGQEMGIVLCLVELSNTILSHISLTSNTSDKPILFLSTESSPCPKITLLSLETQRSWAVSSVLLSAFGIYIMLKKANKHIWQELIFSRFKKYAESVRRDT